MKAIVSVLSRYSVALVSLFLLLLVMPVSTLAQQVSGITATQFSQTYKPIYNDGASTNINPSGGLDDGCYIASMPFPFSYDGSSFGTGTPLSICSNGFIIFNSNANNPVPDGTNYGVADNLNYAIDPFSLDLYDYAGGMYMEVSGTAPGRIYTIEWYNAEVYGYFENAASMQVKFYETTNSIEFWYSNPGNNFGGTFGPQGQYNDPCVGDIGLFGNPYGSDNLLLSTTASTFPATNYRFSTLPNIQLNAQPRFYDFGNKTEGVLSSTNVTVTNSGSVNGLSITSATMSGNADFTILSAPVSTDLIATGSSRTITVQFNPQSVGIRTATLVIVSNGRDSGTQTVKFTGTTLAPTAALDTNVLFKKKPTKMGQSAIGRILIESTGQPTLTIDGYSISGIDSDQYSIVRYPATNIAGGTSDSLLVKYTPTREGRHVATLSIYNNSVNAPTLQAQLIGTGVLPHIVVSPNPVQFDSVAIGDSVCQDLSIYNPGSDTLVILNNLVTSGEGDFTYHVLNATESIIPPDKTQTASICFKPLQAGTREAEVVLVTNIIKTFEPIPRDTAGRISVSIQGNGVPYGILTESSSSVNDTAIVGTQVCSGDTIWNKGQSSLTVISLGLSGTNASEYTVTGPTLPTVIKPGSWIAVNICSTPSVRGLRTASLDISATSNSKPLTASAALSTYGLNVCASTAPNAIFASNEVVVSTTDTECVTVTNCGDVSSVYTAKLPSSLIGYSIISKNPTDSVAAGATTTFCFVYSPTNIDTTGGAITISSPNVSDMKVNVNAIGACAVMTSMPATYPENPGTDGHYTVTIPVTNTGNYPWTSGTGTLVQTGGAFSNPVVNIDPLPAGQNTTITVNFDPGDQTNTLYTGKLTFPNETPTSCSALGEINLSVQVGTLGVAQPVAQNGFTLGQNHPNPFGATTAFTYTTPTEAAVTLTLCDLTGKTVKTIASGTVSSGDHTVMLDASDLSSGTYIIALRSGSVTLTRQIVVTK